MLNLGCILLFVFGVVVVVVGMVKILLFEVVKCILVLVFVGLVIVIVVIELMVLGMVVVVIGK